MKPCDMSTCKLLSKDSTLLSSWVINLHIVFKHPRTVKKRQASSESIILKSNSKYSAAFSPAERVAGSRDISRFSKRYRLIELWPHSKLISMHISDLIDCEHALNISSETQEPSSKDDISLRADLQAHRFHLRAYFKAK
nr:hypothetical protein Itr_chr02CG02010 [Ipomoea trifida]GMC66006.1 hypothetical protein Iba_chr02eCG1550 [Ipomoea batatas]